MTLILLPSTKTNFRRVCIMASQAKTDQERHPENYFNSPVGHPRDRIIIHESAEIPKEGIFFSLNGYSFLAKAGVEIDIPRPVRFMLDTRIRTETTRIDEGGGKTSTQTRNIRRITYTLVKENVDAIPDAAVIDAGKEGGKESGVKGAGKPDPFES
jgi:hypothetical protein